MKNQRWRNVAVMVCAILLGVTILVSAQATPAFSVRHVSSILDTSNEAGLIAVLPDVPGFMAKLRDGDAMRAFFDSPLGLHLLRSAPFRSAAHLHRLITLAPKSWQWKLYSLITDGPVFYRSHGSSFTLVIALNQTGRAITALVKDASAARSGDWLVIASDKNTLQTQLAYMAKPLERESKLDSAFTMPSAISLLMRVDSGRSAQKSLGRALLSRALGLDEGTSCRVTLQPSGNSIGLDGECSTSTTAKSRAVAETITMKDYPGFAYYRLPDQQKAHLIALGGFESDYGYLVPELFFTGPVADQKTFEFLSQAFKTRRHILESRDGTIQIRYPYAYAYSERKHDLFAPHLSVQRDRFFWHSFLQQDKLRETEINVKSEYTFYLSVKLFPLLQNSEKAIRQFDAIYSPGHFHEFRDALFKSVPSLKNASLKFFATPRQGKIRLGGALAFAEN